MERSTVQPPPSVLGGGLPPCGGAPHRSQLPSTASVYEKGNTGKVTLQCRRLVVVVVVVVVVVRMIEETRVSVHARTYVQ